MFSYYLSKGHSIDELSSLSLTERYFYIAAMQYEENKQLDLQDRLLSAFSFGGDE